VLAGSCLGRFFSRIGSARTRRLAEAASATALAGLLSVNFFMIRDAVRPMREPCEKFYALSCAAKQIFLKHANWGLASFVPAGLEFPSNAAMLNHLLYDFRCSEKRTERVFLDQDPDGTFYLSGYAPWEETGLSPGDFDMETGGFSFAEGRFMPLSGPGKKLVLTKREFTPCNFAVTVDPALCAGLIMGYGPGRFMEIGVSGQRLYGKLVQHNRVTPLFPAQQIKPVSPCRMEVRRSGHTLIFFVNRSIWVTIPDAPFPEGRIGFFSGDGGAGQKFYDPAIDAESPDQPVSSILRHAACVGNFDESMLLSTVRSQAEKGSGGAACELGLAYFQGRGVKTDFAEAAKWLGMAARKGNTTAQFYLDMMYATGRGVPKDHAAAARWLRTAAENGDAGAQNNLGVMYATGRGVPLNYAEALRWFRMAAENGDAAATDGMGVMYAAGHGVSQNFAEAFKCFKKAADQDNASAQFHLGLCYEGGLGVPADPSKAYFWFSLAAANGNDEAAKKRDTAAQVLSPEKKAEVLGLLRERASSKSRIQPEYETE
jgi:TPR repeat protein